ncbi:hypothetical protein AAC387_Pa06g1961 [Persea americana]
MGPPTVSFLSTLPSLLPISHKPISNQHTQIPKATFFVAKQLIRFKMKIHSPEGMS